MCIRDSIYGSFAARLTGAPGPPPQDVDVMVVGAPDVDAVHDACDTVQLSLIHI